MRTLRRFDIVPTVMLAAALLMVVAAVAAVMADKPSVVPAIEMSIGLARLPGGVECVVHREQVIVCKWPEKVCP